MRRVIVESPYAGATPEETQRNVDYLRACLADCLARGEAPFASHALYTQLGILDDTKPEERRKGILAGFAWAEFAQQRVVYVDLGISSGMLQGIEHARKLIQEISYRRLGGQWATRLPTSF
jgi:hypothetical protein